MNPTPMLLISLRATAVGSLVALACVIVTDAANAAGSGMPWEAPLQRILESIEGPVAKVVAVVIIIVTGLSLAFGDMGGGLAPADPGRVRPLHRFRRHLLLPVVLRLRRRRADRLTTRE